jgi:hypothetical protein
VPMVVIVVFVGLILQYEGHIMERVRAVCSVAHAHCVIFSVCSVAVWCVNTACANCCVLFHREHLHLMSCSLSSTLSLVMLSVMTERGTLFVCIVFYAFFMVCSANLFVIMCYVLHHVSISLRSAVCSSCAMCSRCLSDLRWFSEPWWIFLLCLLISLGRFTLFRVVSILCTLA